MEKIKIAEDFTKTPGARYLSDGDYSGQEFRDEILIKKFNEVKQNNDKLIIDLDGGFGYGTSFLEEVFGGLQRIEKEIDILDYIDIISLEEPYLIEDIKIYVEDAKKGNKK